MKLVEGNIFCKFLPAIYTFKFHILSTALKINANI